MGVGGLVGFGGMSGLLSCWLRHPSPHPHRLTPPPQATQHTAHNTNPPPSPRGCHPELLGSQQVDRRVGLLPRHDVPRKHAHHRGHPVPQHHAHDGGDGALVAGGADRNGDALGGRGGPGVCRIRRLRVRFRGGPLSTHCATTPTTLAHPHPPHHPTHPPTSTHPRRSPPAPAAPPPASAASPPSPPAP